MSKLFASIKKEFLLLIYDKVGLLLMYLMPIFLVFVITIVQDSTFKLVNENNIEISVVNNDKGNLGDSLLSILHNSGSFEISENKGLSKEEIKTSLLNNNHLLTFEIPSGFTAQLTLKAQGISVAVLHPGWVQTRMVNFSGLVSPTESALGLSQRIDALNLENSGGFWHANGDILPW